MNALTISPITKHTATVIFLHGLGDSGMGWRFLADTARSQNILSGVKFVFPNAPNKPVTLNGGMEMPSWYDIKSLDRLNDSDQDKVGMLESVDVVKKLVSTEIASGIDARKIVIGGFSQGCAVALATSVLLDKRIAGVVGLSGYLPIAQTLEGLRADTNRNTPYFLGHGTADNVVAFQYGKRSADLLKSTFGVSNLLWNEYPGLSHGVDPQELDDVLSFLEKVTADGPKV